MSEREREREREMGGREGGRVGGRKGTWKRRKRNKTFVGVQRRMETKVLKYSLRQD